MHADDINLRMFPEFLQVTTEYYISTIHIALAGIHGFVMITNFMAKFSDFPNDILIITLWNSSKVISTYYSMFCLDLCKAKAVLRAGIHIMPQHQYITMGIFFVVSKGLKKSLRFASFPGVGCIGFIVKSMMMNVLLLEELQISNTRLPCFSTTRIWFISEETNIQSDSETIFHPATCIASSVRRPKSLP